MYQFMVIHLLYGLLFYYPYKTFCIYYINYKLVKTRIFQIASIFLLNFGDCDFWNSKVDLCDFLGIRLLNKTFNFLINIIKRIKSCSSYIVFFFTFNQLNFDSRLLISKIKILNIIISVSHHMFINLKL